MLPYFEYFDNTNAIKSDHSGIESPEGATATSLRSPFQIKSDHSGIESKCTRGSSQDWKSDKIRP